MFPEIINYRVDLRFRKDPNGRLVFLPFGPRKTGYFVDSKSDEDKIRAAVKKYENNTTLISWMGILLLPAIHHYREDLIFTIIFAACVVALPLLVFWVLWASFKKTVAGLVTPLSEVGADAIATLTPLSSPPSAIRRVRMIGIIILLIGILFALAGFWLVGRR